MGFEEVIRNQRTAKKAGNLRFMSWLVGLGIVVCLSVPLVHAEPLNEELDTVAEASVPFGLDTTLDQAQSQSLKRARRLAIEQATGVFLSSSTVVKNSQLMGDLIEMVTRGVIVKEKILERRPIMMDQGEGLLYKTKIQARVRAVRPVEETGTDVAVHREEQKNQPDGQLTQQYKAQPQGESSETEKLNLQPNRLAEESRRGEEAGLKQQEDNIQITKQVEPQSIGSGQQTTLVPITYQDEDERFGLAIRLNKTGFNDGDEVKITVNSESDGYVSLFNVTPDGYITVLAPNRFLPSVMIQADKDLTFPSQSLKSRGVNLRAWVPTGSTQTKETIKAVVTKEPISLLEGKVPEGIYRQSNPTETALLKDLLIALSSFNTSEWADASVNYKITKKR